MIQRSFSDYAIQNGLAGKIPPMETIPWKVSRYNDYESDMVKTVTTVAFLDGTFRLILAVATG